MSASKSILLSQARYAAGSVRSQAGGQTMRSQVKMMSSSSSSSSSPSRSSTRSLQRIAPFAFAAALAFGGLTYASKSLSMESPRRKSYAERMIIEKKEREGARKKEELEADANSSTQEVDKKSRQKEANGGDEETGTASQATSDLEEQASQESAFDPETNTINWDCPCLGGMAHGPCGEEFKKAFSCFVFSEEEPKGIDCVENFKGMQDCFRKYPDHYKEELEDDEEFEREESQQRGGDVGGSKNKSETKADGDDDDETEDEGVREWKREMSKE